jgi:ATP-dependent DNA ligase
VRLYTRNGYDWTARLPAIAAAAERIKANSFTIDGEAVVLGPDGLSRFDDLRRRDAAHSAILYAFDLVEHDARKRSGRRGHRLQAGGWHLSIRSMSSLDQGPQSRRRRLAAGAQ